MAVAELVAKWSKDPSTKVGAVIADGKDLVSIGFNGFPKGVDDNQDLLMSRETRLARTLHAEVNAVLYARRDLTGMTMYVNLPPCSQCAAIIIQSGIKRVVTREIDPDFFVRWEKSIKHASSLFMEAGVEFTTVGGGEVV